MYLVYDAQLVLGVFGSDWGRDRGTCLKCEIHWSRHSDCPTDRPRPQPTNQSSKRSTKRKRNFWILFLQNLTKEQADYCVRKMVPYVDPKTGERVAGTLDYSKFVHELFVNWNSLHHEMSLCIKKRYAVSQLLVDGVTNISIIPTTFLTFTFDH